AKGRLQYRYHNNWVQARSAAKFGGLIDFARILPTIRKRVETDLSQKGMPREKVVALVIKLMDLYHIR
ncbi:MAG: DNA topoisomerase IB, partial [Gammaproteobacteria bacterium]|nr:DNA topoisomerase IB [Gammaproteobacteria bacterium]